MQYLQVRKEGLREQQGNSMGVVRLGNRKYKFSLILFLPTVQLNSIVEFSSKFIHFFFFFFCDDHYS